jgi:thiol-disulfide isomerase/thioredoxin
MKRGILLILLVALCVPAISQGKKTYVIKGAIVNLSPDTRLIFKDWGTDREEMINIEEGHFEIRGELEERTCPQQASISVVVGGLSYRRMVILEPGEITVSFTGNKIITGGTPENDNLQRLNDTLEQFDNVSTAAFQVWSDAYQKQAPEPELETLWLKSEKAKEERKEMQIKTLLANNNFASMMLVPAALRYKEAKTVEPFVRQFERYSYTDGYKTLKEHYEAMLRCTSGAMVKNFTLPAPDGKMVSLSDFRGKWVLLDFWYINCPWCRRMAPNLGKIYAERKDRLEIISINVDKEKDKEVMMKIIEEENMVWTQVNDKTKKDLPEYFGIQSYPTCYLIDPEGRGIALLNGYCEAGGLRRFLDKYMK